jgi:hypothetical protein
MGWPVQRHPVPIKQAGYYLFQCPSSTPHSKRNFPFLPTVITVKVVHMLAAMKVVVELTPCSCHLISISDHIITEGQLRLTDMHGSPKLRPWSQGLASESELLKPHSILLVPPSE